MEKSKWLERYKDPRWQKKRLEILERDEWKCVECKDGESTLHVHHKWYEKDVNLWDYKDICYSTLCEACHEYEHEKISLIMSNARRCFFEGGLHHFDIEVILRLICENDKYTREFVTIARFSLLERLGLKPYEVLNKTKENFK